MIVETGITTIAGIVYMLFERRKDAKRQNLQDVIDQAKKEMNKL